MPKPEPKIHDAEVPLQTIYTGLGRICAKQRSKRKWDIYVDGELVFRTNKGYSAVLHQIDHWLVMLFPSKFEYDSTGNVVSTNKE